MSFDQAVFVLRHGIEPLGIALANGTQTAGAIGIFEGIIAPGAGVHWHTHTREVECFYVVAGRFRFWCGDDVADGGEGTTIVAPPFVRHRWENISHIEGRLLMWVMPGGFEQFFTEVDALECATPDAIRTIETRYGVISEVSSALRDTIAC